MPPAAQPVEAARASLPRRRGISRLRLLVQLVSFATLLYGGFALMGLPGGRAGESSVKLVSHEKSATQLYLPATVCIYQRQGLCRGCGLFLLSDTLTYWPLFEQALPWLLILAGLLLLGGRVWCGWVCPLGLLSDLMTRLREGLGFARLRPSQRLRHGLVVTKYVLLFSALGIAALASLPAMEPARASLSEPFCRICPARVFTPLLTFDPICWTDSSDAITMSFSFLGLVAFGLYFAGLLVRRFWCRLCPVAAISVPFNRTGLLGLHKDGSRCTHCGACRRVCPMDIQRVFRARGRDLVTDYECTLCLRCVEACPEEACLRFVWLGKPVARSGLRE